MKTICKLMSQLLISIVFNLGIVTMCAGQINFSDDFESYPVSTNIQSIENWKTADQVLVSNTRSRSGSQSIKIATPSSSAVKLLQYDDFVTGTMDFEFYIWREKKASITISPNFAFPNIKFKSNNYVTSYVNSEGGYLEFEPEKWHKISFHINKDLNYFDFRVNDVIIDRGIYQSAFRNILAINNYPGGEVYLDDFKAKNNILPTPKINLLISDFRLSQLNLEQIKDSLWVTVTQEGTQPVEGLEIRWSQNGTDHVLDKPDFKLEPGSSSNVFLAEVELIRGANLFTIDIESKNNTESDYSDNRLVLTAVGKYKGTKPVLLEYTTSTLHGYSPMSIVGAEKMTQLYDKFVSIINMHGNDPMYSPDYYFAGPFYIPQLYANRREISVLPSIDEWISVLQEDSAIDMGLEVSYDKSENQLKCETRVDFLEAYENPLYHTVVLVEDSVTGTSSYYDQANSFSGGIFGSLPGYVDKPQYIPASEMVYRFVGRKAFNGTYGSKVFTSMQAGQSTTYLSTDQMALESITDKHYLISVVMDQNRRVLNHKKVKIKDVLKVMTSGKEISEKELRIYPNPTSSVLRLSGWEDAHTLEIYNTGGSCVLKAMAGPEIMIDQLPNDIYYLKVVNHRGKNTVLPFIKAD